MSDCELAYSSFDCPTRVVTINRCELAKQQTIHPTEKPIKLYGWLLMNYAKPGDRILDTHLGVQFALQRMTWGLKCWGLNLTPVISMPQSNGCCTTKHN